MYQFIVTGLVLHALVLTLAHNRYQYDPLQIFAVDNANYSLNLFCRCDQACLFIGDCCQDCPGALNSEVKMESRNIRCSKIPDFNRPVMVSYGCLNGSSNRKVVNRCENIGFYNSSRLYVDDDGLVYPNVDCVLCNDVKMIEAFMRKDMAEAYKGLRFCQPSVDFCTISNIKIWNRSLSELCYRFSAPVMSTKQEDVIFKNVFCALCNGSPLERLTPFTKLENVFKYFSNYMLGDFQTDGRKMSRPQVKISLEKDEIPAAFSILLNFGLDGRENMMFSSSNAEKIRRKQEKCGNSIWDPFSEVCRKLYCSVEYVLVDFRCVRRGNDTGPYESEASKLAVYDNEAKAVELKLSMQTSALELMLYYESKGNLSELQEDLRMSLSKFYKITPDRIQSLNLTTEVPDFDEPFTEKVFNRTMNDVSYDFSQDLEVLLNHLEKSMKVKVNFTATFLLNEATVDQRSEPAVSKIVNQMVSSVSTGSFEIKVEKVTTRVFAIHQNSTVLNRWCSPYSGFRRVVYWNEEFHMILYQNSSSNENWVKEVYINKTGITYEKGDFVANILFQGIEKDDNNVNISGYVIVCERRTLNSSCSRVVLPPSDFKILPNASLEYYGNQSEVLDLTVFEPAVNDSVYVCFDSASIIDFMNDIQFTINFNSDQALVSLLLLSVSELFLGIVLLTYVIFSELRNLPGCNTINLTLTLFISQLTFLLSQRTAVVGILCQVLGPILHYLILTTFFWMNVMAYDLLKTFGYGNVITMIRPKRKYLPRYMAYAYLTPAVIIGFSVYLDMSNNPVKPMYGAVDSCWISNPLAALVLFAAPIGVILLVNLGFYIVTIYSISDIHKKIDSKTKSSNGKRDVWLYIRIATTMGFTWVFGFLASFLGHRLGSSYPYITDTFVWLFIIFNTLQGMFIFFAFVCNKRVIALYRAYFLTFNNPSVLVKCSRCGQTFCVCKTKLVMARSISTDTFVSILSAQELASESKNVID